MKIAKNVKTAKNVKVYGKRSASHITLYEINRLAKELREKNPDMEWKEAIKEASRILKNK